MLRNAVKTLSVCLCLCVSHLNSLLLVQSVGFSFSTFSQLTGFCVCSRSPRTLSRLSLHPFFLCSSLPPVHRPPATLSLRLFLCLCSHEVCIPHLLCRPDTKEQKAPLLTCSKHSSPLGLFTQLEFIIHSGASARVRLFSSVTARR